MHGHHAGAVVGGQHAEARHALHCTGREAQSRPAPPPSRAPLPPGRPRRPSPAPAAWTTRVLGSGRVGLRARGPPNRPHSRGQRGHGGPSSGRHVDPALRLPHARAFLNTAFFPSFRRISVCDWHPCDLGVRRGCQPTAREPLFPPRHPDPGKTLLLPLCSPSLRWPGWGGTWKPRPPSSCPSRLCFLKLMAWTKATRQGNCPSTVVCRGRWTAAL